MRHLTRIALGTLALAIPATMSAQGPDLKDVVAYTALVSAPNAGLVPGVTSTMAGTGQTKLAYGLQFGRLSSDGGAINNLAARGTFGVSNMATVSVTAGMRNTSPDVGDSQNDMIFGVGGDMMVTQRALSQNDGAAKFILGLNADIGYGHMDGGSATAFSVGAPVSLAFNSNGSSKIVPFLTPSFGYGRLSAAGDSESGTRFMVGGGLGWQQISNGVSVNAGFQKVFIDGGKMVWGLGVTLGGQ